MQTPSITSEECVDLQITTQKTFRKTRDYFGKRKYSSTSATAAAVGGVETGTVFYSYDNEDSNDSGVSTRDMMATGGGGVLKCEPNSPSTASVTSGVSSTVASSPSSSSPNGPIKQRVKIIRLGHHNLQGSPASAAAAPPMASSTPMMMKAVKPRMSTGTATATTPKIKKEQQSTRNTGAISSLDQIKRNKWEQDLLKVMKLMQNMPMANKDVVVKQEKLAVVEKKNCVAVTSSKRRIIPKQRISV